MTGNELTQRPRSIGEAWGKIIQQHGELERMRELIWLRELTWSSYADAIDTVFTGIKIKLPPRPPTVVLSKVEPDDG